jgi:hypothetical protein
VLVQFAKGEFDAALFDFLGLVLNFCYLHRTCRPQVAFERSPYAPRHGKADELLFPHFRVTPDRHPEREG